MTEDHSTDYPSSPLDPKEEVLFRRLDGLEPVDERGNEESKNTAPASEDQIKASRARFEQILARHKQKRTLPGQERSRRTHSDTDVIIQNELSYAVLDPHQDSLTQIASLTSDIQDMCDHLDAKETQIVKLSQQVCGGDHPRLLVAV